MKSVANSVLNALFSSLIVLLLLAGAFFFLYYLRVDGSRHDHVKPLKYEILAKKTAAQSLTTLPVIVIFAYVFSFTVLFTLGPFQKVSFEYRDVAVPSYVFLLVLLMIVIASNVLFVPNLRKSVASLEYRSGIIERGLGRARMLFEKGEFEEARPVLDLLMEIDEKNKTANELRKKLEKAVSDRASLRAGATETASGRPARKGGGRMEAPAGMQTGSNYERGLAEYERGNIHGALFYLERAVAAHSANREIKALYERVRREAERSLGALTKTEQERQRLVKEKERGISLMEAGKYYEAYEVFLPLRSRYPKLADVVLYLAQAEENIRKNDFLPGEAKRLEWFPSIDHIAFLDTEGRLNTVEGVRTYKGDYYFYGVARYRIVRGGVGADRFKYGKWIGDRIVLKDEEGYVKRTGAELERRTIRTSASPEYLLLSGDVAALKAQLNIFEYLRKSAGIRSSGLDVEDGLAYLAKTCGTVFAVYVLALAMSALAWSRRSIHDFPPLGRLFLFFLSVPPLCHLLAQLYAWMNGIIMYTHRYAARIAPKANILLYTLLVNLAFAVCATLYYLSQSSKME